MHIPNCLVEVLLTPFPNGKDKIIDMPNPNKSYMTSDTHWICDTSS